MAGDGEPKSPGRTKISDQIKHLVDLGKDILQQEEEITHIEKTIEEKEDLETKLKEKTKELEDKIAEFDGLQASKESELTDLRTSKDSEIEKIKSEMQSSLDELQQSKDGELASLESAKVTELATLASDKDNEIETLKAQKNSEIETIRQERASLQMAKDALFEEFQEKYKAWHIGTLRQEELEKQVSKLGEELDQEKERADTSEKSLGALKTESEKDKESLEAAERKLKSLTGELSKRKWELEGLTMQLSSSENTLEQEKRELELEEVDIPALTKKFEVFAKKCHELAKKFFLTKLPEGHDSTWEEIGKKLSQSNAVKAALKKTPLSDSLQSQYLRTAAAEKIIADRMSAKIFQQYYLPESAAARREIDEILKRLYADSHRSEAIFRLRLLSAYKAEERSRVKLIIDTAVDEIVKPLEPLLFGTRDSFAIELGKLFREAAELWRPLQRSAEKGWVVNVVGEPEPEQDWDWDAHEDYDTALSLPPDEPVRIHEEPEALFCLFPQVIVGHSAVCEGYALWSNQTAYVLGSIEYTASMPRSSFHGRPGAFGARTFLTRQRDRRVSSMGPSANWRRQLMGDSTPTGLTGNVPINSSFLVRARDRRLSLPGMLQPPLGQSGHEMAAGVPVGNSGA